jgi:drug/metabolite transporter (DMT)-like permease
MNWLIPLSLLIIFELVADIFAKEYSLRGNYSLWISAIISYVVANAFWLNAIKNGSGLAKGAIIFSIISAVLAVLIGVILYKEIVTKIQIFGIILGIISLIFIFWE